MDATAKDCRGRRRSKGARGGVVRLQRLPYPPGFVEELAQALSWRDVVEDGDAHYFGGPGVRGLPIDPTV